ncbi:DNA translocase FtsK 4TM domain-containing protein [Desulfococcaceae bacterium HSG9]|nr:DNA translocase FtsK 4TM domain-containing protein [Desulfococcaceae bacterium HSG9]
MRKEITGLILIFLVLFTLFSLLSYHPNDQSIHNATDRTHINNLFGLVGAYFSGILIGFFGVGAFWTPLLFILVSICFWRKRSKQTILLTVIGSIILMITTGGLFGLRLAPENELVLWGRSVSAGGIVGILLQFFLKKYTNTTGALSILILAWLIGFIMATGFSIRRFFWQWMYFTFHSFETGIRFAVKWRQNKSYRLRKRLLPKKEYLKKQNQVYHPKLTEVIEEINVPKLSILPAKVPKRIEPVLIQPRARAIVLSESGFQHIARQQVNFKDIVSSKAFQKSSSPLTIGLGKDIVGQAIVAALDEMPHLLITGATDKSVGLNSIICSLLYKSSPDDMKLLMVDPKRIEFSMYDGIPHLITPIVTKADKAANALFWAVNEMERRYKLMDQVKARNLMQYNQYVTQRKKNTSGIALVKEPFIVVIIDELTDLMMAASRDVKISVTRLAQMARVTGIHLILATQRPSVDVIPEIIEANIPTRLSFQSSSRTGSKTIFDCHGTETLPSDGDMLFLPPGTAKLQRIHGSYISDKEIEQLVVFIKNQGQPNYDIALTHTSTPKKTLKKKRKIDYDVRYDDAVVLVTQKRRASVTMLQHYLRIDHKRAFRIMEEMEAEGVVGPLEGVNQRKVLIR